MRLRVPSAVFDATFARLRDCGDGRRECQALWVGSWTRPDVVERVVHPEHNASAVGFQLDPAWPAAIESFAVFLFDQSIRSARHGTLRTAIANSFAASNSAGSASRLGNSKSFARSCRELRFR